MEQEHTLIAHEKRKSPRTHPSDLQLIKTGDQTPLIEGLDVSVTGLKLRCMPDSSMKVGDIYPITLTIDPSLSPIETTVRVIWVSPDRDSTGLTIGTQFEKIAQREKAILLYLTCKGEMPQYQLFEPYCFYYMKLLDHHPLPNDHLKKIKLPNHIQTRLNQYGNISLRDKTFYQCAYEAIQKTTLPFVPNEVKDHVAAIKFTGFLFSVILDDLLDKQREYPLLEKIITVPFSEEPHSWIDLDTKSKKVFQAMETLWQDFYGSLKQAPNFKQYKRLFQFDYGQHLTAAKHALLLHYLPQSMNAYENQMISVHSMPILINATLDLMYAQDFDLNQLGKIRHIVHLAQYISRMGNWMTTWKEELMQQDYTSGVLAYAVEHRLISMKDLVTIENGARSVQQIAESCYKEFFLFLMDFYRQELEIQLKQSTLHGMEPYLKGIDDLLVTQLTYQL